MGQRPERCAVGQTWLSLLALRRTACPFKPVSIRRPIGSPALGRETLADAAVRAATGEALASRAANGRRMVEGTVIILYRYFLFEFGRAVRDTLDCATDQFRDGERPVRLHVEDERAGHVVYLDFLAGVSLREVVVEL